MCQIIKFSKLNYDLIVCLAVEGDCSPLEEDLLSLELIKAGKDGPDHFKNEANVKVRWEWRGRMGRTMLSKRSKCQCTLGREGNPGYFKNEANVKISREGSERWSSTLETEQMLR